MRRLVAYGVAIPLMLVGSQIGHALAYWLAYPALHVRLHVLAASGHGYYGYMPLALAVAVTPILVFLLWAAVDAAHGGQPRPVPATTFGILPPFAFVVQELLERYLHGAGFAWWVVLQPSFRIGLALQLPFGLAAYLVARLLLSAAKRVGAALGSAAPLVQAGFAPLRGSRPAYLDLVRRSALASPGAGRAPPSLLAA